MVLDLRIAHDGIGSSANPALNGTLTHPNNIDESLNKAANDKIRKYRADYNNNPPNAVAFMPVIAGSDAALSALTTVNATVHETLRFFELENEVGVILVTHLWIKFLVPGIQIFELTLGSSLVSRAFSFFFLFVCGGGPPGPPLQDLCCLISLSLFVSFIYFV